MRVFTMNDEQYKLASRALFFTNSAERLRRRKKSTRLITAMVCFCSLIVRNPLVRRSATIDFLDVVPVVQARASSPSSLSKPMSPIKYPSADGTHVTRLLNTRRMGTNIHESIKHGHSTGANTGNNPFSMENVTCHFYKQPLDHFNPASTIHFFYQQYCIYDGFVKQACDNSQHNDNCDNNTNPIFFYTGNESPIDEYVNNTGLIWELAAKPHFSALVIFAEHRFQGLSMPNFTQILHDDHDKKYDIHESKRQQEGCFTYLTSSQALEDYASLLSYLDPGHLRPVIAFGGSYGGMLSSWMRMKYPSTVAGAIASSAPIWGFPKTVTGGITSDSRNDDETNKFKVFEAVKTMDGASRVVGQALRLPYPPTKNAFESLANSMTERRTSDVKQKHQHVSIGNTSAKSDTIVNDADTKNRCYENLLATWPLMLSYAQTQNGRSLLSKHFQLCQPLQNSIEVKYLISWAQSPWFDLAEGDYPYPSSYIPYALGEGKHNLPPWPLQYACHFSGLDKDLGIEFSGNVSNVVYSVSYGRRNEGVNDNNDDNESNMIVLDIDWDEVTISSGYNHTNAQIIKDHVSLSLFDAVKDAVSVWYNVTKDAQCFDVIPGKKDNDYTDKENSDGPNVEEMDEPVSAQRKTLFRRLHDRAEQNASTKTSTPNKIHFSNEEDTSMETTAAQKCKAKIDHETVWSSIVCNENLNLIITYATGMGNDFYWPPSYPRGLASYPETVADRNKVEKEYAALCFDPDGIFGYPPKSNADPFSVFMDDYYSGLRVGSYSNIIFSNGLLDPWSAAGVYAPSRRGKVENNESEEFSTAMVNGTLVQNITRDGSVIALILDLGGHHLDLMFSSIEDDPPCAKEARRIEEEHITKWIEDWKEDSQHWCQNSCNF